MLKLIVKWLYEFFSGFVPPEDANQHKLTVWRMKMAAAVVILFLLVGALYMMVLGKVGSGFVSASAFQSFEKSVNGDYEKLIARLDERDLRDLREQLVSVQREYCTAREKQNVDAIRFAGDRRRRLEQDYLLLAKERFQRPSCTELGFIDR